MEHRNPENHAAFDQLYLTMKGNGGKRSKGGLKGDKYIQQPIIVESFRLRKKGIKKNLPEIPESALRLKNLTASEMTFSIRQRRA